MEKISKSRKSKMKKTPDDVEAMKLEIAEELGLLDKVREVGWAGLSAKETGRMGGLLTKKNVKRPTNPEWKNDNCMMIFHRLSRGNTISQKIRKELRYMEIHIPLFL